MLTPVKAVKGQTQWEKSGTKQLINFFQELYLRYVNLLSFYSIGKSKKQTFKEQVKADQLKDCLFMFLGKWPPLLFTSDFSP